MRGQNTTPSLRFARHLAIGTGVAIAVSGLLTGPARAQEPGVLEEIVVTAQKREEALQDVIILPKLIGRKLLSNLLNGKNIYPQQLWQFP